MAASVDAPSRALPVAERRVLVEILRDETTTPGRCWFCRLEGDLVDTKRVTERVDLPSGVASYLLHGGAIDLALVPSPEIDPSISRKITSELPAFCDEPALDFHEEYRSPIVWWPDDHAWFVATELDRQSTYVGAKQRTIERLMADPRLEALEAQPSDSLTDARLKLLGRQM
jgi:hypothetical protein